MVSIEKRRKTRITITIDEDVAEFWREHEFNVSGFLNFVLRQKMNNFHRLKSAQDAALVRKALKEANC